jgi:hypothetical protein
MAMAPLVPIMNYGSVLKFSFEAFRGSKIC